MSVKDSDFEIALQGLQEVWNGKLQQNAQEVSKLRQSNDAALRQIALHQAENEQLREQIAALKDALQGRTDDLERTRLEKAKLEDEVASLQRQLHSLGNFKKAILSLVDGGGAGISGAALAAAAADLQTQQGHSGRVSPVPALGRRQSGRITSPSTRRAVSPVRASSPVLPVTTPLASMFSTESSTPAAFATLAATASSAALASPSPTVDATVFYRQVKEQLDPAEFREFARNIKALNSGAQSTEQTLSNLRLVFGPNRPFLFSQLQRLVRQTGGA